MKDRENISNKGNRLIHEKSPYLLQHAHNPVDWYPWGEEAFGKAQAEDKPIFLSIGYSTCHWCHVMERESFEDEEVARVLNEHFISIKVDREERPDIDHIYMTFCQLLTGSGGWPLTVFMTPEQKPFYAGTYFPKKGRTGMPGLMDVLDRVNDAWNNDKESLIRTSEELLEGIKPHLLLESHLESVDKEVLDRAYDDLVRSFESTYGGFSTAPKFPTPHTLLFLMRYFKITGKQNALDMVEKTLEGMYRGGIFDHIGFGFSRYSTDNKWLIPHFEKMLYDNALLAIAYLEAYQITQKEMYKKVADKIFSYILRNMTHPDGGFYCSEDADSEGVEGKFYVWKPEEIIRILGQQDGKLFCDYYDITTRGNFEGKNIPNRIKSHSQVDDNENIIAPLREKVFKHREKRIHPYKDDKILTSWNGLMITAMATGGRILNNTSYTEAAEKAVAFILERLVRKQDGRLLARYRDGHAHHLAYAPDYSYLIWGLIELYQTTYNPIYLKHAIKFNQDMMNYFWDKQSGGFFIYGKDSQQLIVQTKDVYDGALPSGNSVAALNILRLARLTGRSELEEIANQLIETFGSIINDSPTAYTFFLMAIMFAYHDTQEIVIAGKREQKEAQDMLKALHTAFIPQSVSLFHSEDQQGQMLADMVPFIKEQRSINGMPAAYICRNFACQSPVTDLSILLQKLNE